MNFIKTVFTVIVLSSFINLKAQNTIINNEIGVFLGPVFMQSDYGESGSFSSASSNVGMDFGIAYIADFSDSRYTSKVFAWLSDHMKTRLELSFSKVKLEHDGIRINEGTQTQIDQFKGMKGEVKFLNFGGFGEWYFKSLTRSASKFQPYLLTGISYSSAKSSVSFDPTVGLPSVYTADRVVTGSNNGISFTYGLGARYKLDDVDLIMEGRLQPFLSDEIDGIDTDISADENNDSLVIFKIGAIFHLN